MNTNARIDRPQSMQNDSCPLPNIFLHNQKLGMKNRKSISRTKHVSRREMHTNRFNLDLNRSTHRTRSVWFPTPPPSPPSFHHRRRASRRANLTNDIRRRTICCSSQAARCRDRSAWNPFITTCRKRSPYGSNTTSSQTSASSAPISVYLLKSGADGRGKHGTGSKSNDSTIGLNAATMPANSSAIRPAPMM